MLIPERDLLLLLLGVWEGRRIFAIWMGVRIIFRFWPGALQHFQWHQTHLLVASADVMGGWWGGGGEGRAGETILTMGGFAQF